jgi:hypothetical protein
MIQNIILAIALSAVVGPNVKASQPSPRMLSCRPRRLTSEGTLTLRFAFPHPSELAIRAPDGTVFFLVYDRDHSLAAPLRPLIDKNVFRKIRELKSTVATAVGSPWVVGRENNELIFSQPGIYQVELTEVLESDATRRAYRCNVQYK